MSILDGKRIIVAGGGGTIGWKIAEGIIELGGSVIAIDKQFSNEIYNQSENRCDLRSHLQLKTLDLCSVDEVANFFQDIDSIDGFVNCSYPRGPNYGKGFLEVNINDLNQNISLHLGSAILITQECVRYFKANPRWFSLVNFSSIYGEVAPDFSIYEGTAMTTPIEYALMKSAIQHMNKYVSTYVNDSRFRINSVAPGGILANQPSSFLERYKNRTRGNGMLMPGDITGVVNFLLSDASRYLCGQNLLVDDGFHLKL